jgi:hypothetical protein
MAMCVLLVLVIQSVLQISVFKRGCRTGNVLNGNEAHPPCMRRRSTWTSSSAGTWALHVPAEHGPVLLTPLEQQKNGNLHTTERA